MYFCFFVLQEAATPVKLPKAFLQAMKENILADTRYKDLQKGSLTSKDKLFQRIADTDKKNLVQGSSAKSLKSGLITSNLNEKRSEKKSDNEEKLDNTKEVVLHKEEFHKENDDRDDSKKENEISQQAKEEPVNNSKPLNIASTKTVSAEQLSAKLAELHKETANALESLHSVDKIGNGCRETITEREKEKCELKNNYPGKEEVCCRTCAKDCVDNRHNSKVVVSCPVCTSKDNLNSRNTHDKMKQNTSSEQEHNERKNNSKREIIEETKQCLVRKGISSYGNDKLFRRSVSDLRNKFEGIGKEISTNNGIANKRLSQSVTNLNQSEVAEPDKDMKDSDYPRANETGWKKEMDNGKSNEYENNGNTIYAAEEIEKGNKSTKRNILNECKINNGNIKTTIYDESNPKDLVKGNKTREKNETRKEETKKIEVEGSDNSRKLESSESAKNKERKNSRIMDYFSNVYIDMKQKFKGSNENITSRGNHALENGKYNINKSSSMMNLNGSNLKSSPNNKFKNTLHKFSSMQGLDKKGKNVNGTVLASDTESSEEDLPGYHRYKNKKANKGPLIQKSNNIFISTEQSNSNKYIAEKTENINYLPDEFNNLENEEQDNFIHDSFSDALSNGYRKTKTDTRLYTVEDIEIPKNSHRKTSKLKEKRYTLDSPSGSPRTGDNRKSKYNSDKYSKKKYQFDDIRYQTSDYSQMSESYCDDSSSKKLPQPPSERRRGSKIEGR